MAWSRNLELFGSGLVIGGFGIGILFYNWYNKPESPLGASPLSVYSRNIKGRKLHYEENVDYHDEGKILSVNILRVQNGSEQYEFIDSDGKGIQWMENFPDDFTKDTVEMIVIKKGSDVVQQLRRGDMNVTSPKTLKSEFANRLFTKGDMYYNDVRGEIRKLEREDHSHIYESLERFLDEVVPLSGTSSGTSGSSSSLSPSSPSGSSTSSGGSSSE